MKQIKRIRILILFFMAVLILSGITVFPLETELKWLLQFKHSFPLSMSTWLQNCYNAIADTNSTYPMLAYGFDWLAFAHIMIAIAFIGPLRDPVKNSWVIDWAIISCIAILPLAFIAGPIRQIPLFHILIDCSFGVLGILPLLICRKWIRQLKQP